MMRGVSTWAVAVRRPEPADVAEDAARDHGRVVPARLGPQEAPGAPPAGHPRSRRAVGVARDRVQGARHLRQRAAARGRGGDLLEGVDRDDRRRARAVDRPVLPAAATLANISGAGEDNGIVFVVVEKIIRISIFLGYLWLISRMRDLQRVFQFHGAEHKTISCYEAGLPLTPENAQRFSRLHPRCGTSFLLIVMIVAIVVFAPFGKLDWHWLFISRIVGIPIVAGLAFEAIKWFGRTATSVGRACSCGRASSSSASRRASRPRPACRRDRIARGGPGERVAGPGRRGRQARHRSRRLTPSARHQG